MSVIHRQRRHGRSLDDAKAGLVQAMNMISSRVPGHPKPHISPDGLKGEISGTGFAAVLTVDEQLLDINVKLSFPASLFKGKVETELDKTLNHYFPPAQTA
jgi:hypothetical protein